jgi:hypothetical protein
VERGIMRQYLLRFRNTATVRCADPGAKVRSGGLPASRGPLPKRPSTERVDAPHPARRPTEAYPQRYGEGGQRRRGGCSGHRMPGSDGMVPWMPVAYGANGRGHSSPVSRRWIRNVPGERNGSERSEVASEANRKQPASPGHREGKRLRSSARYETVFVK